MAITKISNQYGSYRQSKGSRRFGYAPGRVKTARGSKAAKKTSVCVENINITITGPALVIIVVRSFLFGVGYKKLPANLFNIKWRKTGRDAWIRKAPIYIIEIPVSYTHLRAHETPEHLVCRLLLEKK